MDKKKSLIFIPDITGFTSFVKNTEIDHASHIINELLQIIVDKNELDLSISEIEGDAVLFYKHEEVPDLEKLIQQAKTMFVAFHSHLKRYETQRVCQCGACSGATMLSLKFVVHSGEIGFTNLLGKEKPFGHPMVEAHKLLKNNVKDNEYLLFTNAIAERDKNELPNWVNLEQGNYNYDELGVLKYQSLSLAPCLEEVEVPDISIPYGLSKKPIVRTLKVNQKAELVYEMISNLNYRERWNKVRALEFDKNEINRVGTLHKCLFDKGQASFTTIRSNHAQTSYSHGEKLLSPPLLKEVSLHFLIDPIDEQHTVITIEVHIIPYPFIGYLMKLLIQKKMMAGIEEQLPKLKMLCESV